MLNQSYRNWKRKLIKKLHRGVLMKSGTHIKKLNKNIVFRTNGLLLLTQEAGIITAKELQSMLAIIKRYRKRRGVMEFYCYPRFKLLRKSKGVRMGKGKGAKEV